MSITGFFYAQYVDFMVPRQKKKILQTRGPAKITFAHWERSLQDPTGFYEDCFRFFIITCPQKFASIEIISGTTASGMAKTRSM